MLRELKERKIELELSMVRRLHRTVCDEPGVSVVPITSFELEANIHKSGARSFFDNNLFYDLVARKERVGLDRAGTKTLSDARRQAIEYVQKVRNEYLAVCANDTGGLKPHGGADPMPKALLRSTAQIVPRLKEGEWYDTRHGLEHLYTVLGQRQDEADELRALYKKVSIRRGGKGLEKPLASDDLLMLSELLFEEARRGETERTVLWDIQVTGVDWSSEEVKRVFNAIARIAPQARLRGNWPGSIVLRLLSPLSAYELFHRLFHLGVLGKVLELAVADVRLAEESSSVPTVQPMGRLSHLMQLLRSWNPPSDSNWLGQEDRLAGFLNDALQADSVLLGGSLQRNIRFEPVEVPFQLDFLLSWPVENGATERIGIELSSVRSTSGFFQKVSQVMQVGRPLIFVLVGKRSLLSGLEDDIRRLEQINANVSIIIRHLADN